jgi:peptidoglycan endopeptidase LytE
MEYRAVKQRCAVDLVRLSLPISEEAALNILQSKGFVALDIDLIALARTCIKRSGYRRGAQASEAPSVVDCSSFIKWLYGERGIWLPRRTIQQRNLGEAVDLDHLCAGDVVFTSGRINYYETDPLNGVGHVGIATDVQTIIHAANKRVGIIETPLQDFLHKGLRGIRRYIPHHQKVITLKIPNEREVEMADDIRWIILQEL